MKMLGRTGRFVAAAALLIGVLAWTRAGVVPQRAPLPDVTAYEVSLRLVPATMEIEGKAVLHVNTHGARAISLTAATLDVTGVRVNDRPLEIDRKKDVLEVSLSPLSDSVLVTIYYRGVPSTGLYKQNYSGTEVIYSDSWPTRAAGWMPGVHRPSDPARFSLDLTIPRGYEAVASGLPGGIDSTAAEITYSWAVDKDVPTYTFAFAVSDFAVTSTVAGDSLPIRYVMLAPDSARASLLNRTPEVLAFFSDLLGPYAFSSFAAVEVPLGFGGMENAAAPFIQADLFRNGSTAAEEVLVHEAVHQWFGNRVVIADWRDLWLSEGIAEYLTTVFYEATDGPARSVPMLLEISELTPQRLASNGPLVPTGEVDPDAFLNWIPYKKGASVLHILRTKIGDEAFFGALRTAYTNFSGKPLSTEQFKALFEESSGRDLDAFFNYWVYGTRFPVLVTRWQPASGTFSWETEGDDSTLENIPFSTLISQGKELTVVTGSHGSVVLQSRTGERPSARPLGVMMRVRDE